MQSIDTDHVLGCARRYGCCNLSEPLDEQDAFVRAYVQLIREIHARARRLATAGAPGDYLDELAQYVLMTRALLELARRRHRSVEEDLVYRELLARFGTL